MKKFISTKMKIFMTFLLTISIVCYIAAGVTLYNSDYKVANYVENWDWNDWNHWNDWSIGWGNHWDNYNSSGSINQDLASTVENININASSADVSFQFSNQENIQIQVKGNFSGSYNYTNGIKNIIANEKEITIEANESHNCKSLHIEVLIPTSYKGNITINSQSGEVKGTGGDLNALTINTSSGDIQTYNVISKSTNLSANSGTIYLSDFNSASTQVKTSSGDIEINGSIGDASVSANSGEVELKLHSIGKNSDINTTSGSVELTLPTSENYKLNYTTSSGNLDGSFGNVNVESNRAYSVTNGDGSNSINVKTTSGDLDLQ